MKKKLIGILLLVLLIASSVSITLAEPDIAHRIWQAMAEAGNIDLANSWELMGMYTFGETTGDGYVTLPMTDNGKQISGAISWRMYPKSEDDITERYFPMLMVLLSEFCEKDELLDIADWLLTQEAVALLAKYNVLPYQSDTQHLSNFDVYIKYDEEHHELYCLITATNNTATMFIKK